MSINGLLRDMSLYNLLELLRAGTRSGVLLITNGDQRGMVYIADGVVMDALLVRDIDPAILAMGGEALRQMLGWDEGVFTFDQVARVESVISSLEPGEVALQYEDVSQVPRSLELPSVTLDTFLDLVPQPPIGDMREVRLDMVQWRILSHVSPYQNVREICEATGLDAETALRNVMKLLAIGMVKVISPSPSAGVSTLLSSHYYMPALVA
jgi:hypothetical protein